MCKKRNIFGLNVNQIGYREKAREEASRGGSLLHRPDIALATEVSKLTSQVCQTKLTTRVVKMVKSLYHWVPAVIIIIEKSLSYLFTHLGGVSGSQQERSAAWILTTRSASTS